LGFSWYFTPALASFLASVAAFAGELNSEAGTSRLQPTNSAPRNTALRDRISSCLVSVELVGVSLIVLLIAISFDRSLVGMIFFRRLAWQHVMHGSVRYTTDLRLFRMQKYCSYAIAFIYRSQS
jgi:hypothetical protein